MSSFILFFLQFFSWFCVPGDTFCVCGCVCLSESSLFIFSLSVCVFWFYNQCVLLMQGFVKLWMQAPFPMLPWGPSLKVPADLVVFATKKYKKDVHNVHKGISKFISLKFGIKKVYV
jgi:hypothetical protein